MGYEKTEPKNNIILISGVGSALLLAILVPAFHSYFNDMTEGELTEKVWAPDADGDGVVDYVATREALLDETRERIEEARTSLDVATSQIAQRGRRIAPVEPRRNDGIGVEEGEAFGTLRAVKGWNEMADESRETRARKAIVQRREREEAARDAAAAAAASAAAAAASEESP